MKATELREMTDVELNKQLKDLKAELFNLRFQRAIALETLQQAVAALTAHGLTAQVTQIAVSRSRAAGSLHLLMANNPVFLIARE